MNQTVIPLLTTLLAQTDAAAPTSKSLLGYIHSGGIISYVLVALSILAVALMVTNLVLLRRQTLAPDHVVEGLEPLLSERNLDAVQAFCRVPANDSFLARIVSRGLAKISRSQLGMLELKPAVEEAGARELMRIERPNQGLAMLAAVGPMLGLLGTVIGMIGAFATISNQTGAARNQNLSDYMSIALVCTAEGLIIAIPCTFAYAMFKRRTERVAAEVGDTAERLLSTLASGKAAPPRPAQTNLSQSGPAQGARTGAA